jgi:hypothetical protein
MQRENQRKATQQISPNPRSHYPTPNHHTTAPLYALTKSHLDKNTQIKHSPARKFTILHASKSPLPISKISRYNEGKFTGTLVTTNNVF